MQFLLELDKMSLKNILGIKEEKMNNKDLQRGV